MKTNLRHFGVAATLAALAPCASLAQTEPVFAADITRIAVATGTGSISSLIVTTAGSGYSSAPTVTVTGGGGSGAVLEAVVSGGAVTGLNIINPGTGYTSAPTITIAPPGQQATATASVTSGSGAVAISPGTGGSGYTAAPTVTVTGISGGTGFSVTAVVSGGTVTSYNVTPGTGYTGSNPVVTIAPPGTTAVAEVRGLGDVFTKPFQNESYGPVGTRIDITALGRGTYPVGGYTYTFYANGIQLGTSTVVQPPGGGIGAISWAPVQPGSYQLTCVVSDGLHTVTTLAVRYFATGTAIIGPVDNALVPNGSSVVIQATATPTPSPLTATAFVQRMDFYVDDVLVGSDSTYPYSFIYTPAPSPTTHIIEVRGYDNNGVQISPNGTPLAMRRLSMVTPIGTPPIVRIVNPPDGGSVQSGSAVNLIADAVAPDGYIKNVDFYLNGVLLSSTQTFPFTAAWTPQVPGRYQFVAIGFDDKSNAVSSAPITLTVTGAFPTAAIINPERSGLTVVQGSTLPVTVRAAGADGGLTSLKTVEFLVDGVVSDSLPKATVPTTPTTPGAVVPPPVLSDPLVFNWKANVAIGTHRLSTRVVGTNGLSITSAEVTVNVVANQPPRVAISAPTASSLLVVNTAGNIVTAPSDVDGTIELVEFFANGIKIGSATKAPWQLAWTPAVTGAYDLTARAVDNGGAAATSAVVTVNVDPPVNTGPTLPTISYSVFRGDYGSTTESGRFALAVNRNNRGTLIAYSTAPSGRSYVWPDIAINPDGSFAAPAAGGQPALTGITSATGVSGTFGGHTYIGPVTSTTGAFIPLMVAGSVTGVPNSTAIAIVGGDSSVTLYVASGANREVGSDVLSATGNFSFAAVTGGRFTGTVANLASIVSGTVSGSVAGNFLLRQQASRIANISARTLAGGGDRTLVAGFVIAGTGSKPLLIRAAGPTLANFGVPNPLVDPSVAVQSRLGATVASNDDWGNTPALVALSNQVGAFPLTPGSRDAAVATSLLAGTYTAVVGGSSATPGAALVEIYDTEVGNTFTSRITNISTRGQVGAGEPLIAGFVITGDLRKRVLIRAVGPTLANFGLTGLLADPRIDVISGTTIVASNNDWTDPSVNAQVAAVTPTVGGFPLNAGSKDAAIVLQLAPGAYTVQIAGVGAGSGTVLVEIYDADL
ncbi:MAG: hypothetical protein JNK23_19925 [Opitutaceae bacterium]|nr:hypothetical protein [Opitutaceae bacterium]